MKKITSLSGTLFVAAALTALLQFLQPAILPAWVFVTLFLLASLLLVIKLGSSSYTS